MFLLFWWAPKNQSEILSEISQTSDVTVCLCVCVCLCLCVCVCACVRPVAQVSDMLRDAALSVKVLGRSAAANAAAMELPVPLLPPLILGGQHVPVRERPKWPRGRPTSYGPDGPPPDATNKRRPEETPIASAKRWRESRADAAPTSTATTSCADSMIMNPAG